MLVIMECVSLSTKVDKFLKGNSCLMCAMNKMNIHAEVH